MGKHLFIFSSKILKTKEKHRTDSKQNPRDYNTVEHTPFLENKNQPDFEYLHF